ncbi:MAG: flavin-nucleotide-binding protein [Rhodobacterales bacterium]|nr:MAG: flavin-nucleotide-binding protein [Rhodobacterales bacterium]
MTSQDTLAVTDRSRLRRAHQKGHFDRKTIYEILDAQPLCTVGYVLNGAPYVTPTLQWREGDRVYWHGSSASRALKAGRGAEVCLSVALLDGFVLARSGMHHSVNSRSVTLFGTAHPVPDAQKEAKLQRFLDGLFPGRVAELRRDHPQDLKATMILGMKIAEGAAKIRTGGPVDDPADLDAPVWAGVLPVQMQVGPPEPDPHTPPGTALPEYVKNFSFCAKPRRD